MITRTTLTITTTTGADAGGSGTTEDTSLRGKLHAIYADGGFSSGCSVVIKGSKTGFTAFHFALAGRTTIYPRERTVTPTGVSISGLLEPVAFAGEGLNVVVATGGSAKTGVLTFIIDN
jgi:hypothetical protein